MPEIRRPVKTIEVNYLCDKCENGMMRGQGEVDLESGEMLHRCVICGHEQTFVDVCYPRIDYVGENEA